jgi:uncharacterized protein
MDKQDADGEPSNAPFKTTGTPSAQEDFFIGPNGLRAGWRFFLYLVLVVCSYQGVAIFYRTTPPRLHSKALIWNLLIGEVLLCAIAFIPAIIMAFLEKRPLGAYGLPARQAFGKQFWTGTAWGLVSFSILIFSLRVLGVFAFGPLAEHGLRALKFGVFYAGFFLLVGFTEEFMLRGYSQFTLAEGIGFWPSAVALSLVFGLIHLTNSGETVTGILGIIMVGLIFCLTLKRTGSLWFAVGLHAAWDWAESFVYSVADSGNMVPGHLFHSSFHGSNWLTGGTAGPEGSVLIFILLPAMGILFAKTHPAKAGSPSSLPSS